MSEKANQRVSESASRRISEAAKRRKRKRKRKKKDRVEAPPPTIGVQVTDELVIADKVGNA